MTEVAVAKKEIALSSTDGQVWTDIDGKEVNAAKVKGVVTRVVIGKLGQDEEIEHGAELLREALSLHGQSITHLHLWNLKNLKTLETLPLQLHCLDLRGCSALTGLPDLPESLETLDLEGCEALESLPEQSLKNLRYLHLDGCTGLDSDIINTRIRKSPALRELTLSRLEKLDGLSGLNGPGNADKDLRKLVLNDCSELTGLPNLEPFELLNHLNLNGCAKLAALPDLPVLPDPDPPRRHDKPVRGLRYLVTHGCKSLREYRGLDLRAVHRSRHSDENIIDTIRAFRYLGDEPAELLSSKLLLLGSGRVGKTTLAKSLQWAELTTEQKQAQLGSERDPLVPSAITEKIQFHSWRTSFNFFNSPPRRPGERKGTVHIWDFGGQELYHNTHRLFAGSGSVFVIVCCDRETHERRVEAELRDKKPLALRETLRSQNQYRPVRYWLDYVCSALKCQPNEIQNQPVILVHSSPDENTGYIKEEAGEKYANAIGQHGVPIFRLNRNHPSFPEDHAFRELRSGLSSRLAHSAESLGTRVPAFYRRVHQEIEAMLADNEQRKSHAIMSCDDWSSRLQGLLVEDHPELSKKIHAPVIKAVTRYLHNCGQLFWLDQEQQGEVLVYQHVGAKAIYALCHMEQAPDIQHVHGRLTHIQILQLLEENIEARQIGLDRLVRLLEKCDIGIRTDGDSLQVLHPDLLPELDSGLQSRIQKQWFKVLGESGTDAFGYVNHCFRLAGESAESEQNNRADNRKKESAGGLLIGEADFQAVLGWAVRGATHAQLPIKLLNSPERKEIEHRESPNLRWQASYEIWRSGIQILMTPHIDAWHETKDDENNRTEARPMLLRIQFVRFEEDGFEGTIGVELLVPEALEERAGRNLLDELLGEDGPLSFLDAEKHVSDRRPGNKPREVRANPRGEAWPWTNIPNPLRKIERHDVAISVRGCDAPIAQALHAAFVDAGLSSYYYHEDERCKLDKDSGPSGLMRIYKYLDRAKCLVLICTKDYFDLSNTEAREGNLYCPVELASAVNSVSGIEAHRQASGIVPFGVSAKDGEFDWAKFEELATATLMDFQKQVFEKRKTKESIIDVRESKWVEEALLSRYAFYAHCGRGGSQIPVWVKSRESKEAAIQRLVERVKRALDDTRVGKRNA